MSSSVTSPPYPDCRFWVPWEPALLGLGSHQHRVTEKRADEVLAVRPPGISRVVPGFW